MIKQAHAGSTTRSILAAPLRAVPAVLLRLCLGVLALVLMMGALFVGAVLTIGLLTWSLLRGRRLAPGAFSATFQRSRARSRTAAAGAVIDVEARVVPEPTGPGGLFERRD